MVERDKEEDGFVRFGWEDTKEGDTVGGARLTIETGSLFTIGINLLHASVVLAHGLTLVTHNVSDYANIPGLTVDDWLTP